MTQTPVLDLLREPTHWTKGTYAKSKSGLSIGPTSKQAVCWCLRGAIAKCYSMNESDIIDIVNCALPRNVSMVTFNDNATHEQLIKLLEQAQI